DAAFKKASEETEGRVKALQAERPPEPGIHALWDRGEPSPTYVYRRGDPQSPGRLVGPGVPSVLTDGRTPFAAAPPCPGAAARGWSVKAMHRLMMTSATYRQSSAVTPDRERLDPDNALLSRMPLARLDAEALYDTLLLAAGRLDEARFGPPDPVQARPDGLVT